LRELLSEICLQIMSVFVAVAGADDGVAAVVARGSGVGGDAASTAGVAAAAVGVTAGTANAGAAAVVAAASGGLSEQQRRLHILKRIRAEVNAIIAARFREELSMREFRMKPLDMWQVLKRLEPLRVNPPKWHRTLFDSQQACPLSKERAQAAAMAAFGDAATIGCIILDDAPDRVMCQYNLLAMESLLECLQGGRGHLRLQGLTHVQGGCMVLEPFANVLHFSEPLRNLERSCFEHCRHLLEDVMGNSMFAWDVWCKLDLGSNPQIHEEKKCATNVGVKSWRKPFVGAMQPHTDTGGLLNVRLVFSFAAVTASEGSEDDVSFNPPTLHAGADLAACCATVIGRLTSGAVTLQVGGVGFHAVGPLAPGCLRLALLYNVVLVREFDFRALPPLTKANAWPALTLPKKMHEDFVAQARDLVPEPTSGSVFSKITREAIDRGSGKSKVL
jgi:hypothetical protein